MKPEGKPKKILTPLFWYSVEASIAFILSLFWVIYGPNVVAHASWESSYSVFSRVFNVNFSGDGDESLRTAFHKVTNVYPNSPAAQQSSSVILIDQSSLDDTDFTWPLPYTFHAAVIDRILDARPIAVVVDFLLVDDRKDPTLDELVKVLKKAARQGVPVIWAQGSYKEYGDQGILAALDDKDNGVEIIKAAGWSGGSGDMTSLKYSLAPESDGQRMKSIAMAAYEVYCASSKISQKPCEFNFDIDIAAKRDMWVFWSSRLADPDKIFFGSAPKPVTIAGEEEKFHAVSCERKSPDGEILASNVDEWFGDIANCPPQIILPAQYLIMDPDVRINRGLKDRVVFYGFNLEGFQDYVKPPTTITPVSGVFLHAMAFENLVEWGEDYLAFEMKDDSFATINANFIQLATMALIFVINFFILRLIYPYYKSDKFLEKQKKIDQKAETDNTRLLRRWRVALFRLGVFGLLISIELIVVMAFLAFVVWSEITFLRIAPVNWMGIIGLSSLCILVSVHIMQRKHA